MNKPISVILLVIVISCLLVGCSSSLPKGSAEYLITYYEQETAVSCTFEGDYPKKHTYGTDTTLVDPIYTGTGDYVFGGWYREGDCSGTAVTILGAEEYSDAITLYAKWLQLYPVGGRIFHMQYEDYGAQYRFFKNDKTTEISFNEVSDLPEAVYYAIIGTKTADKFYAFDTGDRVIDLPCGTSTEQCEVIGGAAKYLFWGYYDKWTDTLYEYVGGGKKNTEIILSDGGLGVPTDYEPNVWAYVKACRDMEVGGCTDWFLPNRSELDLLRFSGLAEKWFKPIEYDYTYLWSSGEHGKKESWYWDILNSYWYFESRDFPLDAVVVRSF